MILLLTFKDGHKESVSLDYPALISGVLGKRTEVPIEHPLEDPRTSQVENIQVFGTSIEIITFRNQLDEMFDELEKLNKTS